MTNSSKVAKWFAKNRGWTPLFADRGKLCFRINKNNPVERSWLVIKEKAQTTFYRKKGARETGMPKTEWQRLWEMQDQTGVTVRVMFVHKAEDEVRWDTLSNLSDAISHEHFGNEMDAGGTMFFRYESIPRLGNLRMFDDDAQREEQKIADESSQLLLF